MLEGNGNVQLIIENNNEDTREGERKKRGTISRVLQLSATTRFDRSFHKALHCLSTAVRFIVDSFAFCRRCERFQFRRNSEKKGERERIGGTQNIDRRGLVEAFKALSR